MHKHMLTLLNFIKVLRKNQRKVMCRSNKRYLQKKKSAYVLYYFYMHIHFPGGSDGKESACKAGDPGSNPWIGTILWRRKWQPTPVFLPGESHGQRSLVGDSPWGHKESDTAEQLTLSHFTFTICVSFT